jgi:hypothetical protein
MNISYSFFICCDYHFTSFLDVKRFQRSVTSVFCL